MASFPIVFAGPAASVTNRATAGIVALYEFDELVGGNTVEDRSGVSPLVPLTVDTPANVTQGAGFLDVTAEALLSSGGLGSAAKIGQRLGDSGALTIEAWVRPTAVGANGGTGPARIVTMSDPANATSSRNFLLGQGEFSAAPDDHVRARVRSSDTNDDGTFGIGPPVLTPDGSISNGVLYHMVLTVTPGDDTNEIRLYVNAEGGEFASFSGSADFSGTLRGGAVEWDNDFVLCVANENESDGFPRHWLGELHLLAIFERALLESEVEQNFYAGPNGVGEVPVPEVNWDQATYQASEIAGTVLLSASLSGSRNYQVSVPLVQSGTAVAGVNFAPPGPVNLSFPAGETTDQVLVNVLRDSSPDGDFDLTLTMQPSETASIGGLDATTLTITDVDQQPTVRFVSPASSVRRPFSTTIAVEFDRPYFQAIDVAFRRVNSSAAVEGEDYTLTGDSADAVLTIPAGETSATIDVLAIDNGDGDEDLLLRLTDTGAAIAGVENEHTLTILSAVAGEVASDIDRGSLRWTFDQSYTTGRYVTGDPWVLAPGGMTVTNIQAIGSNLQGGSTEGSQINQAGGEQGWVNNGLNYNASLRANLPIALSPGDSLISAVTNPDAGTLQTPVGLEGPSNVVELQVLTVVSTAPTPDSFRPPFAGTTKPTFTLSQIDRAKLPNLTSPVPITASTVRYAFNTAGRQPWEFYLDYMDGPIPDPGITWQSRQTRGCNNAPPYYNTFHQVLTDMFNMVSCSGDDGGTISYAQIEPILIRLIQYGIDTHYGDATGWRGSGMHKAPTLLAGFLMDVPEFLATPIFYRGTDEVYEPLVGSFSGCFKGTGVGGIWPSDADVAYRHGSSARTEKEQVDPGNWIAGDACGNVGDGNGTSAYLSDESYRRWNMGLYPPAALLAMAMRARGQARGVPTDMVEAWKDSDILVAASNPGFTRETWFKAADRIMYEDDGDNENGNRGHILSFTGQSQAGTGKPFGVGGVNSNEMSAFARAMWATYRPQYSPAPPTFTSKY